VTTAFSPSSTRAQDVARVVAQVADGHLVHCIVVDGRSAHNDHITIGADQSRRTANVSRNRDHPITSSPAEGRAMLAIIAAVLFGLALIFELAGISLDIVTSQVLVTAGLLCVALHLAGVGARSSWRARR
jgi:hypothetical protein